MTRSFPIWIACALSIMEMLQMKDLYRLLAYYAVLIDCACVVVIFATELRTLEKPIVAILSLKLIKQNKKNS